MAATWGPRTIQCLFSKTTADLAAYDVSATVGFDSDDCDRDFRAVVERGAIPLEPPTNKPWGVRAAYFKGQAH
jgi:uncharacterized glyoxalase superfamily protein PhnB